MSRNWKTALLWSYRILLSISIAVAGICLATQCLHIYNSGDRPFSPESVAAAFCPIAAPVYICGALVIVGLFLKPLLPCPKAKVQKNYDLILSQLQGTTDLSACPEDLKSAVLFLRSRRKLMRLTALALLAVGSLVFLFYGANPNHYHQTDINGSMVGAMLRLLPCMAVPFGFGIFAAYHRRASIQKEIALLKSAPTASKRPAQPAPIKECKAQYLRWGILAAAVLLIVGGYIMGGAVDVLTKAVNICTECIGLG